MDKERDFAFALQWRIIVGICRRIALPEPTSSVLGGDCPRRWTARATVLSIAPHRKAQPGAGQSCRTVRSKAPDVPRSGERLLRSGHWKRGGVVSSLTSMASLFTMRLELAFQMDMMLAADSFTIREE